MVKAQEFDYAQDNIVDVAEATCFTFLCVMEASSPIDRDIRFLPVETCGTFHAAACTDPAKLEQTIKDGAVITNIEFLLFFDVRVHVIGCDFC